MPSTPEPLTLDAPSAMRRDGDHRLPAAVAHRSLQLPLRLLLGLATTTTRRRVLTREEIGRLVGIFARTRACAGSASPAASRRSARTWSTIARDVRRTLGIEEVALTTNGHRLAELAAPARARRGWAR